MENRKIDLIVIHCSASAMGTTEEIRNYHIKHNGWKDIGYHYVIERSGEIKPGRPESEIGAHCLGYNAKSLGVCLIGNNESYEDSTDDFTEAQLVSLFLLCRHLRQKYSIPIEQVKGHYELDQTGKTCPQMPGFLLRRYLKGNP